MRYNVSIPEDALNIIDALAEQGCQAYFVGGAVRDAIMGREPHDWDICTSATPDKVIALANDMGLDVVLAGIKHGTVGIISNGDCYEITTYRKDGYYSDGRRPDSVELSDNVLDDLERRDFTINAITMDRNGSVIDTYGGEEDIDNKIIRCVGNPVDRFREDGLRIMRALRFAAQFGFEIEENTSRAIHMCTAFLDNVSKERIKNELCKILISDGCGCNILDEYRDIISYVNLNDDFRKTHCFGDFDFRESIDAMSKLKQCELVDDDLITRLALLFNGLRGCRDQHHKSIVVRLCLKDLKFSNKVTILTEQLVRCRHEQILDSSPCIKRLLNKLGEKQLRRLLLMRELYLPDATDVEFGTHDGYAILHAVYILKTIIKNNECYSLRQLEINGDYLLSRGVRSCKGMSHILNLILNLVMNECVENEEDTLKKVAEAIIHARTPLTKGMMVYDGSQD